MTLPETDSGIFRYMAVEKHILRLLESGELRVGDLSEAPSILSSLLTCKSRFCSSFAREI